MLRVPCPRIEEVRRRQAGRISPGDSAVVCAEPGLLGLLARTAPEYQAPQNLPLGLAIAAGLAVLAPSEQSGTVWVGRDADVEWPAVPSSSDTILAEVRLLDFLPHSARFDAEARTPEGLLLMRGRVRLAGLLQGRPASFASDSDYNAVRFSLAQARLQRAPAAAGRLLTLVSAPEEIPLGCTAPIQVAVANSAGWPAEISLAVREPFGAGLIVESSPPAVLSLAAGETRWLDLAVRACRPHEVNLSRPWRLEIEAAAGSPSEVLCIDIRVPDPAPGRVFYILSEDCETFDGGPLTGDYGAASTLGNHNNFMDPEDYRVQMIAKPDRLNEIADRHGARWTHFWAATQRFAAAWAAGQSTTGEWPRLIAELDGSVRRGCLRHEYAPHIHYDYEPGSHLEPQPRLIYDPATDGLLPNDYYHPETNPSHRYHDWDGSARGHACLKSLGTLEELDSKAGSLHKSHRFLARLQANRRAPLLARTGSYDFGRAPEDQEVSTEAYLANGLYGNSDTYSPGARPPRRLFWCRPQDRSQQVDDLRDARLVQFAITHDTDFSSLDNLHAWFTDAVASCRGPGVHALTVTCHAMFFRGEPDPFRSLEGGCFDNLDCHLAWVRANYPQVRFATATEALLEFLDYYSPAPRAVALPRLCGGSPEEGVYRFPVRLLGRGIPVSAARPAGIAVMPPPLFSPSEIAGLRLLSGEEQLTCSGQPPLRFTLEDRDCPLTLEVTLRPEAVAGCAECFAAAPGFWDPPERSRGDLLRLAAPEPDPAGWRFSPDLFRLLIHPIAGNADPIARRTHPGSGMPLAAALTGALVAAGSGFDIGAAKIRWLRFATPDTSYRAGAAPLSGSRFAVTVRDDSGAVMAEGEVALRPRPVSPPPAAPPEPGWRRALEVHRSQRAWKVMLVVRKSYDLLLRRGWQGRLKFLAWLPALLAGRPAGLEEYELNWDDPR